MLRNDSINGALEMSLQRPGGSIPVVNIMQYVQMLMIMLMREPSWPLDIQCGKVLIATIYSTDYDGKIPSNHQLYTDSGRGNGRETSTPSDSPKVLLQDRQQHLFSLYFQLLYYVVSVFEGASSIRCWFRFFPNFKVTLQTVLSISIPPD